METELRCSSPKLEQMLRRTCAFKLWARKDAVMKELEVRLRHLRINPRPCKNESRIENLVILPHLKVKAKTQR